MRALAIAGLAFLLAGCASAQDDGVRLPLQAYEDFGAGLDHARYHDPWGFRDDILCGAGLHLHRVVLQHLGVAAASSAPEWKVRLAGGGMAAAMGIEAHDEYLSVATCLPEGKAIERLQLRQDGDAVAYAKLEGSPESKVPSGRTSSAGGA